MSVKTMWMETPMNTNTKSRISQTSHAERWERHYGILKRRFEERGDANVSRRVAESELKIGEWLREQRQLFRSGKLSADRISRLEAIGIEWNPLERKPDKDAALWEKHYLALKRRFEAGDDANVTGGTVIDGMDVGTWLLLQRSKYRRGQLTPPQVKHLEAIRIELNDPAKGRWDKHYELLNRHFQEGLDTNVPDSAVIGGLNIGTWLRTQRIKYRAGSLEKDKINRLEAIGVDWEPQVTAQAQSVELWEKHYAVLRRHFELGNDANVTRPALMDGLKIGAWLNVQREKRRDGDLSQDQIDRLDAIGIEWNPMETRRKSTAQWEKHFLLLKALFEAGKGDELSDEAVVDGKRLGAWLKHQRLRYRRGKLADDCVKRLEAIGVAWRTDGKQQAIHAIHWNEQFELLRRRFDEDGEANVSVAMVIEGCKIGEWLATQRRKYRRGLLTQEQIDRLASIGINFNPGRGNCPRR